MDLAITAGVHGVVNWRLWNKLGPTYCIEGDQITYYCSGKK